MTDILDASLAQVIAALEKGRTDPVALVDSALERANVVNRNTNAFLRILDESARSKAGKLLNRPRQHALQGVPLAHKDCFAHAGECMTLGATRKRDPDTVTATVIQRLNDQGSIEIGRLHLSEIMAGPSGNNALLGDCLNAWNPDFISGGSSSGSGVAVASGSAYAALGTDTGGSVRIPAALNGLFGLRPSFGRVSRYGSFPRSVSIDAIGPLTRTAQDCALMMQAIAGSDPLDSDTLGITLPDYPALLETAATGSRLAVFSVAEPIDTEVQDCLDGAIRVASRQWGQIGTRKFDDWQALYALGDTLSKIEAAQVHWATMASDPESHSKAVYTRTEPGLLLPATRYIEALKLRPVMLQRFIDQAFGDADVLMLPTLPMATPRIADFDMEKGNNVHSLVPRLTCLTRPFSYLGLPAMSMPMGLDSRGLPLGLQLIGKPYAEARLLSVAHRLSLDLGWSFKPSSLPAAQAGKDSD